ncbi:MAG: M28 family peptidase [Leadbetterella sp.]|nr:M28 family peptidase [Leadbetterella sp.]
MKKLVCSMLGILAYAVVMAQSPLKTYEATITEADLKKYLTYIASDELEGRDTGSEGQKKAARYIIQHLEEWGLQPIVNTPAGKSYLQTFPLYKGGWGEGYVNIGKKKMEFFKDYIPSGLVNIPEEKGLETIFVGYGVKDDNRDDYKGKDVKGKAVVFLSGDGSADGQGWSGTAGLRRKSRIATDLGAAAIFEVFKGDESAWKTTVAERKAVLSRFSRMDIEKAPASAATAVPAFVASGAMGADLLGVKSSALEKYRKADLSAKLKTKPVTIRVKSERADTPVETANVMGFLEGTDRKDEVVVISAHYDHVGIDEKGQIYNGADDDGSGTCAVLELAQAFAQAKKDGHGPRRSMLFLWVTGEEKGLLGSLYFTDHDPVIPLKDIVCDLNIDMIGRVDKKHESNPEYTYIIGSDKLSSELHAISEKANKESVNLELDYEFNDPKDPNRFYYRSDHYNFAKNKIPIAFYFTGVHEDYHRPGDDVEKILFPRYARIVKLVYHTAWELANRDKRIVVDSNKP